VARYKIWAGKHRSHNKNLNTTIILDCRGVGRLGNLKSPVRRALILNFNFNFNFVVIFSKFKRHTRQQDGTRQHESLEDAGMLTERILFMFLRQECTRMQAHGTTEWDAIVAGSRLPATTPHGFGPRWLYCAAY
jgi:hypothetical protein